MLSIIWRLSILPCGIILAMMSFPTLGSKLCSVLRHLLRKGPSTESSLHSLATITIDDICFGLDHETFTAVDLVNAHIARIHEVNSVFNAVIEINPDAVDIAKELDKEMKVKKRRRSVPFGLFRACTTATAPSDLSLD